MRTFDDQLSILRDAQFGDGLTEAEIQEFENRHRIVFPRCFRVVLELSKPSRIFEGCDSIEEFWQWKELEGLGRDASLPQFHPQDFVFDVREGYLALFFRADGTNDPEVYCWTGIEVRPTGSRLSHEVHFAIEANLLSKRFSRGFPIS